jgi:signal transduction histidine kinase
MQRDATRSDPDARWLLLSHVLFGVTLGVPTMIIAVARPAGWATTLAVAAAFGGWYVVLIGADPASRERPGRALVYAVGALAFYTVLNVRDGSYLLLLYGLLPQFFSMLPRGIAVAGVAGIAMLPTVVSGGVAELLADRTALFNLLASVGLGLAVTAIIEALDAQSEQQRATITELEEARAEIERLAAQAASQGRQAGVLAERQRLAHEIHDTLAQGLTSIVVQLEAAEQALDHDPATAAIHLDRARRTARDSLGEARRTLEDLRPEPLDRGELVDALRTVAERWRDAQPPGVEASVAVDGEAARLSRAVDAALLRVTQEALANVARHARAQRVAITLSYLDDAVLLDVQDDGVGFDAADAVTGGLDVSQGGYGLHAMRERMALLGGRLIVESRPGDGTTVAACVPRPADDRGGAP